MTDASSPTAYATAAQMLLRYDANTLGDLVNDDGTQASPTALLTNTSLAAALQDASGEIERAALRGARYSAADLNALSGMAAASLVRLTCNVAMMMLLFRRKPTAPVPEWYKSTQEDIERLANGERIFGTQEAMDAGSGMEQILQPDELSGPRPALSQVANRFFGDRARTYPVSY